MPPDPVPGRSGYPGAAPGRLCGRRRCCGQATVELVALLPLVVGLLLLAWQVVLIGQAGWSVHAAARAAARAQAVGGDRLAAARATVPGSLDQRLRVTDGKGDPPAVAVRLRVPAVVPGLPTPTLTARSTFADQS